MAENTSPNTLGLAFDASTKQPTATSSNPTSPSSPTAPKSNDGKPSGPRPKRPVGNNTRQKSQNQTQQEGKTEAEGETEKEKEQDSVKKDSKKKDKKKANGEKGNDEYSVGDTAASYIGAISLNETSSQSEVKPETEAIEGDDSKGEAKDREEKRKPYVNPERVLTGGQQRGKLSDEELAERMARMKEQNDKIKQRRLDVQADEDAFRKTQEAERARIAHNRKVQESINQAREQNAKRKMDKAQGREWDSGKPAASDWKQKKEAEAAAAVMGAGEEGIENAASGGVRGRGGARGGRGRGGARGRGGGPGRPEAGSAPSPNQTDAGPVKEGWNAAVDWAAQVKSEQQKKD